MLTNDWKDILKEEFEKDYMKKLKEHIKKEYNSKVIYPKVQELLKALELTSYGDVKVVILGQDPYHGENQAEGLAFSVKEGVKMPPSLINIYKELYNDLGIRRTTGSLVDWAKQGILLLNTVLTVEKDKANSHKGIGWEMFTTKIIQLLNQKNEAIVFVLWGNNARELKKYITNNKHLIIESAHPSPLSAARGFFNSKPFSKINNFLKENNLDEINW